PLCTRYMLQLKPPTMRNSNPERAAAPLTSDPFVSNDTERPTLSSLSLHDALPISMLPRRLCRGVGRQYVPAAHMCHLVTGGDIRSEEHTSELQSQSKLVCPPLLQKKNTPGQITTSPCSGHRRARRKRGRTWASRAS